MWRWLDVRGRGPLGEFWLAFFLYLLVTNYALLGLSSPDLAEPWRCGLLAIMWLAALLLWIVAIRRFHDMGDSGWISLYLMPAPLLGASLITIWDAEVRFSELVNPLIGFTLFLSLLSTFVGLYALKDDSANGRNRFGPDPTLARRGRPAPTSVTSPGRPA